MAFIDAVTAWQLRLMRYLRLLALVLLPPLALAAAAVAQAEDDSRTTLFDIPPQAMRTALLAYSEQAGVQLILAADTKRLRSIHGLEGRYELRAALDKLLMGSGLEYRFSGNNTVTVRRIDSGHRRGKPVAPEVPDDLQSPPQPLLVEEITTLGSRAKGRTAVSTPVPVDVMTVDMLAASGQVETGRMLQMLAPSFNFSSSSVSDGTDALRPATLRGLGPDQTLVLVNGKRRHSSALVHVNTSVGRGTAGVDMNAVPPGALDRIEILRDGASAQYGSDAIAGVINLVLSERREGGEASVSHGQTFEGDGKTLNASAAAGFTLGRDGFFSLSATYRDREATNRAGLDASQQYFGLDGQENCLAEEVPAGCYDPREASFDRRNFRIGDAKSTQRAFVANAAMPFDGGIRFYGFATYSERENLSAGFYRRANQADRTVAALYPDGFLPQIGTTIEDVAVSIGAEIDDFQGWQTDMSFSHGHNSFRYDVSNSLNASLGAASPRAAGAGALKLGQWAFSFDLQRELAGLAGDASVAIGGEYRQENYRIVAGESASYLDGGMLNHDCPGCDLAPVRYLPGFQVFHGFSPANEVDAGRHNISFYAELDMAPLPSWQVSLAARFEDYSDFGHQLTGKLATRYDFADGVAFRGSLSNGFRAPSVQQIYFNSVSTQFVDRDGETVAQERGTFRNDGEVARLLGVPELQEEKAFNISMGMVLSRGEFTLTADYYHIRISDRITISGAIDIENLFPTVTAQTGASAGQFFINAADTVTNGFDLVALYEKKLTPGQRLRLTAAANLTDTRVLPDSILQAFGATNVGPLFTRQDISILEDWQPNSRLSLTADYLVGGWQMVMRLSRFGGYEVCEGACDTNHGPEQNIQYFGAKWLTDFQFSYRFAEPDLTLSLGVNNLFDIYPDKNLIGQAGAGMLPGIVQSDGVFIYSRRAAPFGFNGGYWYARLTARF